MPKLKTGGSALSATGSKASPSRKRSTSSNMGRMLTPSEIESLKSDVKRINEEARQLIANDATRRLPQAA